MFQLGITLTLYYTGIAAGPRQDSLRDGEGEPPGALLARRLSARVFLRGGAAEAV